MSGDPATGGLTAGAGPGVAVLVRSEIERKALSRRVWITRIALSALVVLGVSLVASVGMIAAMIGQLTGDQELTGEIGHGIFVLFATVAGWGALALGPFLGATLIRSEKQTGALEPLILAGFTGHRILVGKAAAALMLCLGVVGCGAPILWLAVVLGGGDGVYLLAFLGWVTCASTWGIAVGLLAGSWFRSTVLAVVVAELALLAQLALSWAIEPGWVAGRPIPLPGSWVDVIGWLEPVSAMRSFQEAITTALGANPPPVGPLLLRAPLATLALGLVLLSLGSRVLVRVDDGRPGALGRRLRARLPPALGGPPPDDEAQGGSRALGAAWAGGVGGRRGKDLADLFPSARGVNGFALATFVLLVVPALAGILDRWVVAALGVLVPGWMGARAFTLEKRSRVIEVLATTPASRESIVWARARSILRVVPVCSLPAAFQLSIELFSGRISFGLFLMSIAYLATAFLFVTYLGIASSLAARREETAIVLVALGLLAYTYGASQVLGGVFAVVSVQGGAPRGWPMVAIGVTLCASNLFWAYACHVAASIPFFKRSVERGQG